MKVTVPVLRDPSRAWETVHEASAVRVDTGHGASVYIGPAANVPGAFIVKIDPVNAEATEVTIETLSTSRSQILVGVDTNSRKE